MAMEAIEKITQLEQEARKQRDAAAVQAKQMISQTYREEQRFGEQARLQAEKEVKAMMARAEQEAAERGQARLEEAKAACEEMKKATRGRLDRAARLIVEKVVSD